MKALMWLERDIRTHDHEGLRWLAERNCEVSFVSFLKKDVSSVRQHFHLESLLDFQGKFQTSNSRVHLLQGDPTVLIPRIFALGAFDYLIKDSDLNFRDIQRTKTLLSHLPASKVIEISANTLISSDDLPFAIADMPKVFTDFRKKVEQNLIIRDTCVFDVTQIKAVNLNFEVPEEVSLIAFKEQNSAPQAFCHGGEIAGLQRVENYFQDVEAVLQYKELRNGMITLNHSTKFSPYLANGNLSARYIYQRLKKFERAYRANKSTYWILFELLWRDYFKFLSLKIGAKLFGDSYAPSPEVQKSFQAWQQAQTAEDFVNAHMNELRSTGWMSNRGRQNVASFLAKTLNVPWTLGAQYFRHHLIDYDTESNWGNWLYLSGEGTDPRNRVFNVKRQADMYDPHREYINKWLPFKAKAQSAV